MRKTTRHGFAARYILYVGLSGPVICVFGVLYSYSCVLFCYGTVMLHVLFGVAWCCSQTLDYDRSGVTKMKKSVKALYSSGNSMHLLSCHMYFFIGNCLEK